MPLTIVRPHAKKEDEARGTQQMKQLKHHDTTPKQTVFDANAAKQTNRVPMPSKTKQDNTLYRLPTAPLQKQAHPELPGPIIICPNTQ